MHVADFIEEEGTAVRQLELAAPRLDAGGNPIGSEFQVNLGTLRDQRFPEASVDANGALVVAWLTRNAGAALEQGAPLAPEGPPIYGGRYFGSIPGRSTLGEDGTIPESDGEFEIAIGIDTGEPVVVFAPLDEGSFLAIWEATAPVEGPTTQIDLSGQAFSVACGLFCDSFESGDTASWSSEAP